MIKGVLFDMDGLMLDTEKIAQQGWAAAAKAYDYPITEEVSRMLLGRTRADSKQLFFTLFGDSVDYDKAQKYRTEYLERYIAENGVPVKDGLLPLLEFLREQEIPCCVATSTGRDRAEGYLREAGVLCYFAAGIYGDMVTNGKPDPEIFLKAAELLGLSPADCAVLEDSKNGIRAGHAAGCKVIAVPDLLALDDMKELYFAQCKDLNEAIAVIRWENER